jgi:hypothetical protein
MLFIGIILDEIQSSFTGEIKLFLNTGGVRAAKKDDILLKFKKLDSVYKKNFINSPPST